MLKSSQLDSPRSPWPGLSEHILGHIHPRRDVYQVHTGLGIESQRLPRSSPTHTSGGLGECAMRMLLCRKGQPRLNAQTLGYDG